MTDSRTQADNAYRFYRQAAVKAGEHDDIQQLSRGLSVAKDIYCAETWRILCEEILPTENKEQSNRGMTLLHCQQTRQAQTDKATKELPIVVPVVEQRIDARKVVSLINHKEIYARRREQQSARAVPIKRAVSR